MSNKKDRINSRMPKLTEVYSKMLKEDISEAVESKRDWVIWKAHKGTMMSLKASSPEECLKLAKEEPEDDQPEESNLVDGVWMDGDNFMFDMSMPMARKNLESIIEEKSKDDAVNVKSFVDNLLRNQKKEINLNTLPSGLN